MGLFCYSSFQLYLIVSLIQLTYGILRALSLDVVGGAVIVSILVASLLGVQVPTTVYLALAITVWLIYTWDHLADASSVSNHLTYRHQFHHNYKRSLIFSMIVGLVTLASLVFYLPPTTVYFGIAAGALVFIYFLLVQLWDGFVYKEIVSALCYSLGVFVGPLSVYDGGFSGVIIILYLQILLLAIMNLMLFSLMEKELDQQQGFPSIVRVIGSNGQSIINLVFLLYLLITAGSFVYFDVSLKFTIVLLSMGLVLVGINNWQEKFRRNEYYRILGDGIFFIPLLAI